MGGMQRIITNKANYLSRHYGYEVIIITATDKMKPYYALDDKIRVISLNLPIYSKSLLSSLKSIVLIYVRLKKALNFIKADVVISLFGLDMYVLPFIKDGSYKLLEIHISHFFWSLKNSKGFLNKSIRLMRNIMHKIIIPLYNRFIVLTEEDKNAWGNYKNSVVIPNTAKIYTDKVAKLDIENVIAVGRLDYQKNFADLINAWSIVNKKYNDWHLKIIGHGNLYSNLKSLIESLELSQSITIVKGSNNITTEYLSSSFLVLSSRYEGLPMVFLEAMSLGLPIVSYSCPCGPKDVIKDNQTGLLVKNQDYKDLADKIIYMIENKDKRIEMGKNALVEVEKYKEDVIMEKWNDLFLEIIKEK